MRLAERSPQPEPIRNRRQKGETKGKTQEYRTGDQQNLRAVVFIVQSKVWHERSRCLQIDGNIVPRSGASDQHVADGGVVEWLGPIADGTGNQPGFTGMADSCPARPPHRHVACLGKLEQALEGRIPTNDESAARERYTRADARDAGRRVRRPAGRSGYAGRG